MTDGGGYLDAEKQLAAGIARAGRQHIAAAPPLAVPQPLPVAAPAAPPSKKSLKLINRG